MPNLYGRLPDMLAALNATGATGSTTDCLRAMAQSSRAAEHYTSRRWYSETATAEFSGNGKTKLWLHTAAETLFRDSLISATSVKVDDTGDGTFEITMVEDTDYWLYPDGGSKPGERLDIVTGRTTAPQVAVWPKLRRNIQIIGKWGYSELTDDSGLTGTLSSSSDTTITAVEGGDTETLIFPGDMLLIESEQVYVTKVDDITITVQRAQNGTTAAAHTTQSLLIRRYPEDVEWAVVTDAARKMWQAANGYQIDVGANAFSTRWPAIRDTLNNYRIPVFA